MLKLKDFFITAKLTLMLILSSVIFSGCFYPIPSLDNPNDPIYRKQANKNYFSMHGTIVNKEVNIDIDDADASYVTGADYGDNGLVIRIVDPNDTSIKQTGIGIGTSSLITTGASLDLSTDNIIITVLSDAIQNAYGFWGIETHNGTLNIELFEGNHIKGSYSATADTATSVSGSFDVFISD